jgi:DNA polymerase III alpha subunit
MTLDNFGVPIYSSNDVLEIIYNDQASILKDILVSDSPDVQQYNLVSNTPLNLYQTLDLSIDEFDHALQSSWAMPTEYKQLDIEAWLYTQTPPWDPNHTRVEEELAAYKSRNMIDLLRWLKYFVDTCRANNVVWGVGRGSSVASYVLFLIGVHRIDSIKYNLDWQEFLR